MFLVFSISILATCLECPFLINDAICKSDRAWKANSHKVVFFRQDSCLLASPRHAFFSGPTTTSSLKDYAQKWAGFIAHWVLSGARLHFFR